MLRVLFIGGKNRWRGSTAEQIFAGRLDVECASAGLSQDADTPLSAERVAWAELICVMELEHKARLLARFKPALMGKRVVCLDIPDRYAFMDPKLVDLLERKVTPLLQGAL
jgi:predicted protein tyrosine phosphatase